jgi:aspartate-semialdehyde dehydrogenase
MEGPVRLADLLDRFRKSPGIRLREGTPATGGEGGVVEVGPVRPDAGGAPGVRFGVSCDNLLKGSALNAVQIAEKVFSVR